MPGPGTGCCRRGPATHPTGRGSLCSQPSLFSGGATPRTPRVAAFERKVCDFSSCCNETFSEIARYSRPSSRMRRQRVVRLTPRTRAASCRRQRQASSAPRIRAASTASASARRAAADTARLRAGPAGVSSTLAGAYDALGYDLARQVFGQDRLPLADGDRVLERVLELAHVAGPRVLEEQAQHVGREAQRAALARAHPRQQEGGEGLDVLAPLAQRRDLDRHDAQAVEEVLAEAPLRHRAPQVHVRGRDDASVSRAAAGSRPRARRCAPAGRAAASPAGAGAGRPPRRGRACRRRPSRSAPRGRGPRR